MRAFVTGVGGQDGSYWPDLSRPGTRSTGSSPGIPAPPASGCTGDLRTPTWPSGDVAPDQSTMAASSVA